MKRLAILWILGLIGAASASAGDCEPEPSQMLDVQQKMMSVMGPGPEHEVLGELAGEWAGSIQMWPMAGMEPMVASVDVSSVMVLGGRFLQTTGSGTLMGMPMDNIGYYGYDRRHGKYTMLGLDTMGTYYVTGEGSYDPQTRTLTFEGTDVDPIGGVTQDYVFEHRIVDENTNVLTLTFRCPTFGSDGPHKLMEIAYTRKQVE